MIEYIFGMRAAFGIHVNDVAEIRKSLNRVRKKCRCSAVVFRRFVQWYFSCYALKPPTTPYDLEVAWVDYCQRGECIPMVLDADRIGLHGSGCAHEIDWSAP